MSTVVACTSIPASGPLAEGSTETPRITAVDTMRPPHFAWIQLDKPTYTVLMLVAPGHTATLLYPEDSTVDNHLGAGTHQLTFRVPGPVVLADSIRNPDRSPTRARQDSAVRYPGGVGASARNARAPRALEPTAPVFLLLVTSPQPLVYRRVIDKTAGVSIPSI